MGHEHTAVLDFDHRVFVCGSNEFGQLGIGGKMFEGAKQSEFVPIESFTATSISCGGEHTLALNNGEG